MVSRNRIAVVVNLLIVVSMLLGAVSPVLAAAPTEDSIHPIASSLTPELTDTDQTGTSDDDTVSKAEVLAVLDVVGPAVVTPGEEVTLAVQILNVGSKPIQRGTLQLREEPGMGLAGSVAYNVPEIPVDESFTVQASALVIAKPGDRINARLELVADNLDQEAVGRYQAIVQQGEADIWEPGRGAGLWKPHDRFEIVLPEGRDSAIAKITHRGLYAESAGNPRSLYRFEVNAYSQDGEAIKRFDTPITFRWHYKEALGDNLPIIPPILAWWNLGEERWVSVPTRVNEVLGIIEADVQHFSTYEYQASVTATTGDTISNLSSDLYSGAMRYSYPMPLLQRPNGFAPSLGLSYSSRRRDHDHAFGSNGSLLGWGWRLDGLGQIDWTLGDDVYKLTLNGATYTINKTASWIWYAEEAPELRITRSSSNQNATWHVRTPDGTHYEFNPLQEVWVCSREYDGNVVISETPEKKIRTFVLTRITDAADDNAYQYRVDIAYNVDSSITYTREVDFYCDNSNQLDKEYIFQALPDTMTYYGISGGHSAQVEFSYITRSDYPEGCNNVDCTNETARHLYYYTRALDKVTLKVDSSTARVYDFTSSPADGRLVLDSVRHLGKGGASDLPATTFGYVGETNCIFPENCRLSQIYNGQGGSASISYVGQTSSQYFIYRVDMITVQDGFGNTQKQSIYSSDWNEDADGFSYTQVTYEGGDVNVTSDDRRSKHWFYNTDPKGRLGIDWQSVEDVNLGSNNIYRLSYVSRSYSEPPLPTGGGYQNVRYRLSTKTDRVYGADGNSSNPQIARYIKYFYDLDRQGGQQYGNVTRIEEYLGGTSNLIRTTERRFYPSANIRNRLAEEWVWAGAMGSNCAAYKRLYYDGASSHTTAPVRGQLTKTTAAKTSCDATSGDFVTLQTMTYDSTWRNLLTVKDALNHGITYTYENDFHTFVSTETNTLNHTTTTTYNASDVVERARGLPYRITDPNAQQTMFAYDAFGRPLTVDRPGHASVDESWLYQNYSSSTLPQRVKHKVRDDVDGSGDFDDYLVSWTFHDGVGRVRQVQSEDEEVGKSIVVSYDYDDAGRLWRQSAPYQINQDPGVSYQSVSNWSITPHTQTEYDPFGRVDTVTNPDGSEVKRQYAYLTTTTFDELDHKVEQEQDGFGRLVYARTYTGSNPYTLYATSSYQYDVLDRLDKAIGPDGFAIDPGYNLLGQKTSMSDPDMGAWSYTYDNAGNLQTQTDARTCVTTFSYDALNRLTGKSYAGPGACGTTTAVSYSYDSTTGGNKGVGRRTGMSEGADSSTSWVYDERGRVTKETKVIGGTGGGTFMTQWSYDAADRVSVLTYPGGKGGQAGEQVKHVYNTRGLLEQLYRQSPTPTYTYVDKTDYNALGQPIDRWLGGGGVVRQHYDYTAAENYRLTGLRSGVTPNYNTLQNLTYTYDNAGNVLSITDAAAVGGSQTQSFSYDALNRLLTAQASGSATYGGYSQVNYGYSNAGNITSFEGTAFTYQDSAHKHAVTHLAGAQKYWYDANGNATRRINFGLDVNYAYDAENRLIGVSGGKTAAFTYDGDGRLVKTQVDSTYVAIAGAHYQYSGSTGTKHYYAGNVRVAERVGGTLYWLLSDHLGSTAVTTNASGGNVAELRYYAYGKPRYNVGGQKTDYRFTGQRWQNDLGIYWYNSRWYDQLTGRFLQPDTIVPAPGDPQSLNRYSYAANNPIKYTDPGGHWVETAWDVLNIGWDIAEVKRDPSLLNIGALVVDVGAAVLPFVPAGVGLIARSSKAAKAAVEVASHADEAMDAARLAGHMGDAVQAHLRFTQVGKAIIPDVLHRFGGTVVSGGAKISDVFRGRRVTTIGRRGDIEAAAKRGARVLDDPAWTPDKNADWILEAIANGDVIELVSDVSKGALESRLYDVTYVLNKSGQA